MGDIFKPIEAVLVRATHFLCTLVLGMGEHADVAMRSQDMFGCGQREKLLLTQHLWKSVSAEYNDQRSSK